MKCYNRGPVKNKIDSRCPGACIISLCISCFLRFVYRGVYSWGIKGFDKPLFYVVKLP